MSDGYAFDQPRAKISDNYIRVLTLVEQSSVSVDHVIMLRLDVVYAAPVVGPSSFGIDWDKFNYPFPDECAKTGSGDAKTSDLFWVFPRQMLGSLKTVLRATQNMTGDGRNLGSSGGGNGNGHWTHDPMGRAVGFDKLRFIDERRSSSDISPGRFFLGIDRSCPGPRAGWVQEGARGCTRRHMEEIMQGSERERAPTWWEGQEVLAN